MITCLVVTRVQLDITATLVTVLVIIIFLFSRVKTDIAATSVRVLVMMFVLFSRVKIYITATFIAFDRVSHSGLLFKLKSIGVGGGVLPIFREFLSNRRQRVVVDAASSE